MSSTPSSSSPLNIVVLGSGAWGTALAVNMAQAGGHHVTLWSRSAAQNEAMARERENRQYLPGVALPASLRLDARAPEALAGLAAQSDLVIVATPMSALRGMLELLAQAATPVAWLCKGFEQARSSGAAAGFSPQAHGLLGHEIRAQVAPFMKAGILSGPSFAQEVAAFKPTALVAASRDDAMRQLLVQACHNATLRVYASDDPVGVEVGGAVKNVLAIAVGLCDGLGLGLNARAALITRGLAEMARLGHALGAQLETFMGLSGLGDLVLTATGDLSRNRRVGTLLAQGQTLEQAVQSLGHVAEGVYSARTVLARAHSLQVDMPITERVVDLLDGRMTPQQAIAALMERSATTERQTP
ncbi:MAG: Glycerol-3-phosphate dehydrogenase [NAD(P)+] [Paracidovorax wautersii]|uniref:Glycerol-3-phosphate dehydrogenase [NAD(P)+] n=1 Tax=Paracidovorax wautersii TaxID=1177982 RepID=A0A7V8FKN7_9BURK|nr:MAG: Glycerol-3-phosphate dehydrogenase [NAD(P)+] [Paracidovorax wautersii]